MTVWDDNTLVTAYRTYHAPVGTGGMVAGMIILAVLAVLAVAVIVVCRSEARSAREHIHDLGDHHTPH